MLKTLSSLLSTFLFFAVVIIVIITGKIVSMKNIGCFIKFLNSFFIYDFATLLFFTLNLYHGNIII